MCGIAGFAGLDDRRLLEAMTDSLKHRGPDASGFFLRDNVGLGSRRLAIIDLAGGDQPITGESGCVVVFNGEIYNFQALRHELETRGHPFKTRSDTEVIAHLYEEKGIDGLKELSGMFALALWDPREKQLLLARDPLGVKPLYYAVSGSKLYFGSELKALRHAPGLCGQLDLSSLQHYLDYLYIAAPKTIYAGVSKLQPGERLLWRDGEIQRDFFWQPQPRPRKISWNDAVRELDILLRHVLSDQKVSDVPIGLFLSGGLDSSAVAYYLSKEGGRPEAFCAYFSPGGESFNEVEKARVMARHLGYSLAEFCVRPDVEEGLEALTEALDEPMADSSALPTYWISRAAREKVKVALTGIGGDEVFGGYPRYLGAKLLRFYQRAPQAVRSKLAGLAPIFREQVASRNVGSWARRFLAYGVEPAERAYAAWMGHLSPSDKEALYAEDFRAVCGSESAPLAAFSGSYGDLLQRILAVDLKTYLPEDLLTHADRVSMAVGMELRVPLCDQRLVEFALSLPSSFRVRGWTLKPLLKELLKDKLPREILEQKKQGFMVPIGAWFKSDLSPLVSESLSGLEKRGLFRSEGLTSLFEEHKSGRRNRKDTLWALILLERWFRKYHPGFKL